MVDAHVAEVGDELDEHLLALLEREERLRLLRVPDDGDDHLLEMGGGALDDVEMAVGDRIERAGDECGGHLVPFLVDAHAGRAIVTTVPP